MRGIVVLLFSFCFFVKSVAQPGQLPEPGLKFTLELHADGRPMSEAELKKVTGWTDKPENRLFPQVKDGQLQLGIGNRSRPGDVADASDSDARVFHLKFENKETRVDFTKGASESLSYIIDMDKKEQPMDVVRFKHTYRFSKIDNDWINDTTGLALTVSLKNQEGKLTSVKKHWTTFTHLDRPDSYGMQFWVEGTVHTTRSQTYDGFDGPVLDFVLTEKNARRHMELAQTWGRTAGPRTMHESLNFESWRFSIVPTQSDLKREVTPPFSFQNVNREDLGLLNLKVHFYPKYSLPEGQTLDITFYEFLVTCQDDNIMGYWKISEEENKKYLDLMLETDCDRKSLSVMNLIPIPYTFQLDLPKGTYELRYRNANLPKIYPAFLPLKANSLYAVRVEVY